MDDGSDQPVYYTSTLLPICATADKTELVYSPGPEGQHLRSREMH